MKTVRLHHPTGHAYWQEKEYKVELPDGTFFDPEKHSLYPDASFWILVKKDGIYYQECACGSGYGKVAQTRNPEKLIIGIRDYDTIEYVGKPLEMSETLSADIRDAGY